MGLFKKRNDVTEDKIEALSDSALKDAFHKTLQEYERGVGAKWVIAAPDIDDAMTVAACRDYLHELYLEAVKRDLEIDVDAIKALDSDWQGWILERIPIDMADHKSFYADHEIPKEKWWWWIEDLNSLSEKQRSNL